jgi:S1-C subfamily serine protease
VRLFFLVLLSIFHCLSFSQTKNEKSNFVNSTKEQITGLYRVELRECYNDKGYLYYSTFFEGIIIITENGNYISAKKIKTNKTYFNIIKNGSTYKISDNSEILRQEGSFTPDLFKGDEIKLKLLSTDKDHIGWYSIYTLRRITDKKELYKNIKQGTGFFITTTGYILTNNHVVSNSQLISIYIANKEYECETIFTNEIDDIAIIRVKDTVLRFFPIPFSSKNLEVGDDVIAFGFPLASTMGKELKMSAGIVNSSKGFQDDVRYFQFSASIDPGNSGGPILNKSGNLVGLVTAKYTSATNAGYALNLNNLIKNIPSGIKLKKETKPQTITNSAIYSKYKNSIVLIKAYSL